MPPQLPTEADVAHPYERDIAMLKKQRELTLDRHQLLMFSGPVMPTGVDRERVKAQQVEQLDAQIDELQSIISANT